MGPLTFLSEWTNDDDDTQILWSSLMCRMIWDTLLADCLAYSLSLEMEAVYSSEIPKLLYQTTRYNITEDTSSIIHSHGR
jgi:hypothetical protein